MHEAADRVRFGRVARNSRGIESLRRGIAAADPYREDRFCRTGRLAVALGHGNDRLRRLGRRCQRGRHVHDQNGIVGAVIEQLFERHGVSLFVRVAGNVGGIGVRPDRRQRRIELLHRRGRNVRKFAAEIRETIDREHADPAAIGQDRKALAGKARQMTECLGRGKQFVEIEHPQQTRATERGVIDGIRSGQCAGMRHRRLGALGVASGLNDEHRFGAGGGARRRHELARVLDQFDVEQNRPRTPIHGEEIQQIGQIDVDTVADGHHGGKPNVANRRPFHQSGRNRAGLRDQRKVPRSRHRCGETRIEFGARHQHAEAIGSNEAHSGCMRGFLAFLGERAGSMAETRGEDDAGRRALGSRRGNNGWDGRWRHADHCEIGYTREVGIGFDCAHVLDRVIMGIDEVNIAGKAGAAQILQDGPARRLVARAGADDGDGSRRKYFIETIS